MSTFGTKADGYSYGNAVKDASGAAGPRASTASNPLGVAGGTATTGLLPKSGAKSATNKGTAANPLGLSK
jgi:hypothetical protein